MHFPYAGRVFLIVVLVGNQINASQSLSIGYSGNFAYVSLRAVTGLSNTLRGDVKLAQQVVDQRGRVILLAQRTAHAFEPQIALQRDYPQMFMRIGHAYGPVFLDEGFRASHPATH